MARTFGCIALATMIALTTGCGTVVKRTVGEVRGSSSSATTVPGSGAEAYSRYTAVEIRPPIIESGGLVPAEFQGALVNDLRKQLVEGKEPVFPGGSSTLTVEPHVMWFNKSNPVMPSKYVVVLYYIQGDNAELGRVQIVTKSEATGTGIGDLAESSAKELAAYFRRHGRGKTT